MHTRVEISGLDINYAKDFVWYCILIVSNMFSDNRSNWDWEALYGLPNGLAYVRGGNAFSFLVILCIRHELETKLMRDPLNKDVRLKIAFESYGGKKDVTETVSTKDNEAKIDNEIDNLLKKQREGAPLMVLRFVEYLENKKLLIENSSSVGIGAGITMLAPGKYGSYNLHKSLWNSKDTFTTVADPTNELDTKNRFSKHCIQETEDVFPPMNTPPYPRTIKVKKKYSESDEPKSRFPNTLAEEGTTLVQLQFYLQAILKSIGENSVTTKATRLVSDLRTSCCNEVNGKLILHVGKMVENIEQVINNFKKTAIKINREGNSPRLEIFLKVRNSLQVVKTISIFRIFMKEVIQFAFKKFQSSKARPMTDHMLRILYGLNFRVWAIAIMMNTTEQSAGIRDEVNLYLEELQQVDIFE